ncbi:MAG: DNA-3-methyladenine glycosylase [Acidobacteria bacterium ACB1]|nr:putative 3-methyladenine DNA glycosylase [Pyrinomonadaceae bacterium]MCE7962790.1 DNA-3-methyladenine glycosylase [Acidobacteria bacterium ACB1]RIJ91158.1 MAG: DNA-3-methyladenine glycosylase [Acidobacteriota bacterium]
MLIPRKFYARQDTAKIARELLGKLLVVPSSGRRVSGMIVETEAYLGEIDRAAHSYGGRRTKRNEVMYGEAGFAYVFFVYGMYNQFNCVTGRPGTPHAILIRGIEPVEGIEIMQERRPKAKKLKDLTSGPGKLCIALGIDRTLNGEDLLGTKVFIERYKTIPAGELASGKRIGIDYAGEDAELPLRFWVANNPFVSRA